MPDSGDRIVSRRVMLGGTAGVIGAGLVPARSAYAGDDAFGRRCRRWARTAASWPRGSPRGPVDHDAVDAVAARLDGDLIGRRRDLHRHPETAGQEERTAWLAERATAPKP
jgi:hypothetical protein